MNIDLLGYETVVERFRSLRDDLKPRVTAKLAQAAYEKAREGADSHTRPGGSGNLILSLSLRRDGEAYVIAHDKDVAPYAPFVHWGTGLQGPRRRKYRIPREDNTSAKTLRWPTPQGFRFAKWVMHPGIRPDPWMVRAADEVPRQFDRVVREVEQQWR